ncbi:MAG TPA: hypothetical protein VK629_17505 [Steroidobacteraceae bacterium]|nr:hypothetical protein [Steroidobacteraceae bacterium]
MKSKLFQGMTAFAFAINLGGCAMAPLHRLSNKESPGVRYALTTVKKVERNGPQSTSIQSTNAADISSARRSDWRNDWTGLILSLASLIGD